MVALALAAATSACSPPPSATAFHHHFHPVDTIHLQEPPGDTIAEIGIFQPLPDGGFLISDRFLPRVRRYDTSGALVAAQGRFGDGPFEYRRIGGIGQNDAGQVVVMSYDSPHLTVLTPALEADTLWTVHSAPFGEIRAFAEGVLFRRVGAELGATLPGEQAGDSLSLLHTDGTVGWSISTHAGRIHSEPYWLFFNKFSTAASSSLLFLAQGLLYPIHIYDRAGERVGELNTPPPSYREAPPLQPGALSGAAAQAGSPPLERFIASFTFIAGLHVVGDTLLAVPHGRWLPDPQYRVREEVYALDLYHLPTLTKVAEDIPLPPDVTILGGGAYLHLLVAKPPEPWTIVRWRYGGEP